MTQNIHRILSLTLIVISIFALTACPLVRGTGNAVEAVGEGVGDAVSGTGDAIGQAGRELSADPLH